MITTKVNLPAILDFDTPAEMSTVAEIASEFIPKIKFENLGQVDGTYKAIFYTRKDKNYRSIMEDFGSDFPNVIPETGSETPIPATSTDTETEPELLVASTTNG